ncbi:hypothetical protein [Actinocorallia libanotica]|uniref:DUF1772 domain-containing protein n=1 Tax=Actinocorallia libanotica TaxID=46162 RepID=A0ABP4CFI6_9ACTN
MTVLHSPQPLTRPDAPDHELVRAVQRANHDTALAGWAVTTMALGLVVQLVALAQTPPTPARTVLAALGVPLLAAGTRIVLLLDHASASMGPVPDRVQLLAGIETRRFWTFRARLWTLGTCAAFALWTVAVQVAVH